VICPIKYISLIGATVLLLAMLNATSPYADEGAFEVVPTALTSEHGTSGKKLQSPGKNLQITRLGGDNWVVQLVTGSVQFSGSGRPVVSGDKVPTGERLVSGPGGRALLVRRNDKITMSQNSSMSVGENLGDRLLTNIIQGMSTLLFQVEKNPGQQFHVVTPFLAATVKGTTFTVSIRPEGAAVHVTNGAVQVASRRGRRAVILRSG
jgi:hypothetical protein